MIITQNTTFYTKILLKIEGKSNLLPINFAKYNILQHKNNKNYKKE